MKKPLSLPPLTFLRTSISFCASTLFLLVSLVRPSLAIDVNSSTLPTAEDCETVSASAYFTSAKLQRGQTCYASASSDLWNEFYKLPKEQRVQDQDIVDLNRSMTEASSVFANSQIHYSQARADRSFERFSKNGGGNPDVLLVLLAQKIHASVTISTFYAEETPNIPALESQIFNRFTRNDPTTIIDFNECVIDHCREGVDHPHAALIVGRHWSADRQACMIDIRNSTGGFCNSGNQNVDCSNGVWSVPLKRLAEATHDLVWLDAASSPNP